MSKSDRMIWSTTCNSCLSNLAVWPHWEADDDIPNPEEWDGPQNCPVCSHYLDWEFGDPMTTHIRTGYTPQELHPNE